ncbi:MAG: hypothetical protein PHU44_08030 [Syntrophales bacterium]|nr:hypothetical protein [Syntrophales bacterium]MDD5640592.1 hypothetical protein [Syntrophales bacterium]
MAKNRRPAIIVLGSSRVIGMRKQFFHGSFVNCGLAMSHLNEGAMFLEEVLKFHRPQVILLGLDFWWFNAAYAQPQTYPDHDASGTGNLLYKIKEPFTWFAKDRISLRTYLAIMLFRNNRNKITNYDNMGVLAIKDSNGFREDGSYLHAETIFGFNPTFEDIKFKQTLEFIDKGGLRFEYGQRVSPERVKDFHKIMAICRRHKIPLVVYLAPVAPSVYQKMQTMDRKYAYIGELRSYLQTLPVEFYDFYDIAEITARDCEFFDGFHPGEVLDQRILLQIVEQNPHTILKKYLNLSLMRAKVKEFSGHVLTEYHKSRYNFPETDFLHLGCKKKGVGGARGLSGAGSQGRFKLTREN